MAAVTLTPRRAVSTALSVRVLAALALSGSQAAAVPVHVALDWAGGTPASTLARARIQAVRIAAGPTADTVPIEAEAGAEGPVLDLGEGAWQLQASAPGYWSQGAEVVVGRQAAPRVRIALWPAASLRGEIAMAGNEPLPQVLDVRLSANSPRAESSPQHAELRCPVDQETWSCLGPPGLFDAQIEAAGYAPRYAWGVSLKAAESADLGRTVLHRAASVFGRAVRSDGSSPPGPCRATFRVEVERRGAPEPEDAPGGETSFPVTLSQRGYFQIVGVPPGKHVLVFECPGASGVRELRVQADSETRIEPALLLEEVTLDITLTPGVDPEGRPWQLTVDATTPRFRRIADKAPASADGHWAQGGLTTGSYRVTVNSSDGTPWLQRFFDPGAGSGRLSLGLGSVGVSGRVVLGTRPVRARLLFFNEAGGEPITLTSDEQGHFQGLLPTASGAQKTRWTVEAHATQPPINRRLEGVSVQPVAGAARFWVELALPVFAVHGTVVSQEGQPQGGAQVTFEDTSSRARIATATGDTGTFELPDLPPGKYTVVAESVEGVSERMAVDVVEGIESELKLVLNPSKRVSFSVVSSQGPVADAAVQVWSPPGVPRSFARTDADGRFEVNLPPGTTEVGLTVGAPGYAAKLVRLPISGNSDESPDAHTVNLGVSGGTLVLDLQPPGRPLDRSTTPYLMHDGAIEAVGTLAGWGAEQSGAGDDGRVVIDTIEPGVYSLCLLADPAELVALWQGSLPSNRCRMGSVEQGRTLTLSPK